jgi:hypothetical protein
MICSGTWKQLNWRPATREEGDDVVAHEVSPPRSKRLPAKRLGPSRRRTVTAPISVGDLRELLVGGSGVA